MQNGAKTDETDWCHICFHIFLWKRKQKIETPETNTKPYIAEKQIQTKYGTNMDKKQMITETKRLHKSCRKLKQFK
jgi:hypothetical protein